MDVYCRICNEPWDTWGVSTGEGDLSLEEYRRLLRGEGCPYCKGQPLCTCGHSRHDHYYGECLAEEWDLARRTYVMCECLAYRPSRRDYSRTWLGSIDGEALEDFECALYQN
jgi:hypothetical protein